MKFERQFFIHNRNTISNSSIRMRSFTAVDNQLIELGIPEEKRLQYYERIAAILFFGYVCIEENTDSDTCQITKGTRIYFKYAADLLEIDHKEFEYSFKPFHANWRYGKYQVKFMKHGTINYKKYTKFSFLQISFESVLCTRIKKTFSKMLYTQIFEEILSIVNSCIGTAPTSLHIDIMDLAGFGRQKY